MNAELPSFARQVADGIVAVDTGFHRDDFDAAYIVVQRGRAAIIDTGTHHAAPRLLGTVQALGLAPDAVDWVVPTHVHLDHAGGAGTLMAALPSARLLVHPRGARHMIDPTALWQGATAVYGAQEMVRSYGHVVPVDAARVVSSTDGMQVEVGGRPLHVAHTAGHARHHHCLWDEATRGWFTGDTFGLSYREFDTAQGPWIMPSATPVQFEPDELQASIERLLTRQPQRMYLTHYGCVQEVPRLGRLLLDLLQQLVAMGLRLRSAPDRHDALQRGQLAIFGASLAAHGCTQTPQEVAALLAMDVELNAQGMAIWLDRADASGPGASAKGAQGR